MSRRTPARTIPPSWPRSIRTSGRGFAHLPGLLGGAQGSSEGFGIAADAKGDAYVTGETNAVDFPTVSPVQGFGGGGDPQSPPTDAFVTELGPGGWPLFSTFLGGAGNDVGNAIAVDNSGEIYVVGSTASAGVGFGFLASQVSGTSYVHAFAAKFTPGDKLGYLDILQGAGNDYGNGVAVDQSGDAYVVGETTSPYLFSSPQKKNMLVGGADAFLVRLNGSGLNTYTAYLGGGIPNPASLPSSAAETAALGVAVDSSGDAFVVGDTTSANVFPTATLDVGYESKDVAGIDLQTGFVTKVVTVPSIITVNSTGDSPSITACRRRPATPSSSTASHARGDAPQRHPGAAPTATARSSSTSPSPRPTGLRAATGIDTIMPASALPQITNPVVIDGTSQPGFLAKPVIQLNGSQAGPTANGLYVAAGNTTIEGLIINQFGTGRTPQDELGTDANPNAAALEAVGNGIYLAPGEGDNLIRDYIGTDATGTITLPVPIVNPTDPSRFGNEGNGILIVNSPGNVIGGTAAADLDVIGGNDANGILIDGAQATGNTILGDDIGVGAGNSTDLEGGLTRSRRPLIRPPSPESTSSMRRGTPSAARPRATAT